MKKLELYDKIYNDFGNKIIEISNNFHTLEKKINEENLANIYNNFQNDFIEDFKKFLYGEEMKTLIPNIYINDTWERVKEYRELLMTFDYILEKFHIRVTAKKNYDIISNDLWYEIEDELEKFKVFLYTTIDGIDEYCLL